MKHSLRTYACSFLCVLLCVSVWSFVRVADSSVPSGDSAELGELAHLEGDGGTQEETNADTLDDIADSDIPAEVPDTPVEEDLSAQGVAVEASHAVEASYAENEVLVELGTDATAADVLAALGDDAVRGAQEISDGVVLLDLDAGVAVEDAIGELEATGVAVAAQPNYAYTLMDEGASPSGEQEAGDKEEAAQTSQVPADSAPADGTQAGVPSDESAAEVATNAPSGEQANEGVSVVPGTASVDDTGDTAHAGTAGALGADPEETTVVADGSDQEESEPVIEVEDDELPAEAIETEDEGVLEAAASVNDARAPRQWALASMGVDKAWDVVKTNGSVTVAALDLGFDVTHPDLAANVVAPYNAYNAVNGGNVSDVTPVQGAGNEHGTHVAGIIAAVANNSVGVAGVSYNARIMPVKVVDGNGVAHTADLVKAYDYVMANAGTYNVRVINLSMANKNKGYTDTTLLKKIDEAYNKGIVTVASAGNSSASQGTVAPYDCYPSDYKNVVSVINLMQSGTGVTISSTSNYNAPGEQNKNISAPGTSILSTMPKGEYGYMSGTSMAAPQVSAVLALMFAANTKLEAATAVRTLYASATDIGAKGWDTTYGYGEVNAYEAVYRAKYGTSSQTAAAPAVTSTPAAHVAYRTHVQSIGWQGYVRDGAMAGTSGKSKRLEAIQIKLEGAPCSGSIEYRTHVQSIGWQGYVRDGALSGTSGRSKRLEAIQIRLTGEMANRYDVWYRVHAQRLGWMGWAKDDAPAGTAGYGYRLEGIAIKVLPKGSPAPGTQVGAFQSKTGSIPSSSVAGHAVSYQTHVQRIGWQTVVTDGSASGTFGMSRRLEGIKISLPTKDCAGSVEYRTHVQSIGWQGYVRDGALAGTTGRAKRLEAIQIRLTGDMASRYDVWYRVHAQTFGWMGWAKNDQQAGTAGYGKRLEAIQVLVLPKGSAAPGTTANAFRQKR